MAQILHILDILIYIWFLKMIAACMLFDSMFSIEGWLCCNSITYFNPCMKIYVLCLDARTYHESCYYRQKYSGNIIPVQLYELENHFRQLLDIRPTRPWNAYVMTCKVFLPSYVFDKYEEQILYYVDSDLYFWDNSAQIEDIMGDYSFMISSREQDPPPRQGRFNGGFFSCKNDKLAKNFLEWWQNETIKWCLWEPGDNGRFGEEGYLNIIHEQPNKFPGIKVSTHFGINMSYWNMYKHKLEKNNKRIIVDENFNLICFHYQGMKLYKDRYIPCVELKNDAVRYIYDNYHNAYLLFKEEFLHGMESY